MIGKTLVFAAAVVGFAVLVVPRGETSTQGNQDNGTTYSPKPSAYASTGSSSNWSSGDHTLTRSHDGHFYAPTYLNGTQVRMLVDTGASVIALTGRDASAAGIYWDEGSVRPVARGASGTVYGVPVVLDEVEIGGIARRNVQAIIVPRGLDMSLLGQSYLSKLGSVEIRGENMVMSDR